MLVVILSALAAAVFAAPSLEMRQMNTASCGVRPLIPAGSAISPVIVGGRQVNPPFSYPWMCGLRYRSGSNRPFCGASLFKNDNNEYHLLTAAHCVREDQAKSVIAFCGSHDYTNANERHRQILTFSRIVRHPQYDPNTYMNDVAIIYLEDQPQETNYVRAVCLPVRTYTGGEMATVTGWGRLSFGGSASNVLMEVTKPIVTDSQCQSAYGSAFHPSNMMCAAGTNKDACQGDSGGPLVVYWNNRYEEVGVVSWGYGCAHPSYPGVYADVYALRGWILENI